MKVIVDSSFAMALVVKSSASDPAHHKMAEWQDQNVHLLAPALWLYEVTSVLRKLTKLAHLPQVTATESLHDLLALGIVLLPPTDHLASRALHWAAVLDQTAAYDAAYLAVAEQEEAELWTADKRLARGAAQQHLSWVHLVSGD